MRSAALQGGPLSEILAALQKIAALLGALVA
jgi:hypothetical protein